MFNTFLYNSLVALLNKYQSEFSLGPKQIEDKILCEWDQNAYDTIVRGYRMGLTSEMGDSALVAMSLITSGL